MLTVQQAAEEPAAAAEIAREQARQTRALERIADAMEGLRADFRFLSQALDRIASRTGRYED
jgi:hypothetical protein